MNDTFPPPEPPAPSRQAIVKAIGIALLIAALVLLLAVLPAEYGIDPTGLGRTLGLTRLASGNVQIHNAQDVIFREDSVEVKIPPDRGLEYKFSLGLGQSFIYSWSSDAPLNYDFHGQLENAPPGEFQSYQLATSEQANGVFNAPFEGIHGWYWENNGRQEVSVRLKTAGFYEVVGIPGPKPSP
jgi:hypothetical protein